MTNYKKKLLERITGISYYKHIIINDQSGTVFSDCFGESVLTVNPYPCLSHPCIQWRNILKEAAKGGIFSESCSLLRALNSQILPQQQKCYSGNLVYLLPKSDHYESSQCFNMFPLFPQFQPMGAL